jgi:large subunit ribosomal protein L24
MANKFKLRSGDEVVVLTGRCKGQTGKITKLNKDTDKVVVSGLNLFKKHKKPDAQNPDGGIIEKPMPLHVSNVALLDPKTKKPTRIGYKFDGDRKIRVAKKSQTEL